MSCNNKKEEIYNAKMISLIERIKLIEKTQK